MKDLPARQAAADKNNFSRESVQHGMVHAHTAVAVIFAALLIFAMAAVLAGLRATQSLKRAEQAEANGRERLRTAYLAQARAMRLASEPGRRTAALQAVSNAAALGSSFELRTEAIASLALSELTHPGELVPTPHYVRDVAMDSELEHFAFVDAHGITVYNSRTKTTSLIDKRQDARSVSLSPDGKILASKLGDGTVLLWNLDSGQRLNAPRITAGAGLVYSLDSSHLIFSDTDKGGQIGLLDLKTLQKTNLPFTVRLKPFRVSPDFQKVAINTDSTVAVYDSAGGTNHIELAHAARALLSTWSRDGRKLAVSCEDGEIYLWDMVNGGHRILSGHSAMCVRMEFSPDGTLLFSSSQDGTTRVWNTFLGQTIATGEGIAQQFSRDARNIGFWLPWKGFGVWELHVSPFYSALACDSMAGPLFNLDLSTNGEWCVATHNKGIRVLDLREGVREFFLPLPDVLCARFSPDVRSLLVCRKSGLEEWPMSLARGNDSGPHPENARQIPLPDGLGARAIVLNDDGSSAAVELTDERFAVLDLSGKRTPVFIADRWNGIAYKGPGSSTGAGRFVISPDGRWVATGFNFGQRETPKIWDARTGQLVVTIKAEPSLVGFSPDGHWLGLAGVNGYSFISTDDWNEHSSFALDKPSLMYGVMAFASPAGTIAVSRSRRVLDLRDFLSGQKVADLMAPIPQSINAIRISMDGSMLVSATASDMVEVWRLGKLRNELARMGMEWNPTKPAAPVAPHFVGSANWLVMSGCLLALFSVAAAFTLLNLRRHRLAIERLVEAEAVSAQQNRELDTAKAELMHSQKMRALGTLAAGIAHDFNNLLSVIRMSNKLIARHAANDVEIKECTADIEQAVMQGKGVVSSMLGYTREKEDTGQPVDATSIVEDVVSLLSKEFLRGIALTLELEREVPMVSIGRGALEQILLNLIVNASEAMQGQGKLKIIVRTHASLPAANYVLRPRAAGHYVELSVIDSGPGISLESMNRLFEPFFTTKRTGSKPGTGLGLSLVYSMAQQAEAGLNVENGKGGGAVFTLLLPISELPPVRQTHSS